MIGQTLSHYRITEKLGEGGMGVVYKADDTQLRIPVALKFLPPTGLSDEVENRLIREAQTAAALDHPNICRVYRIHREGERTFIAMAFVDGPTLDKKIQERRLPLEEALDIAIQAGEGLQEAHQAGIIHRDIKPQNIMLTSRGQVKIMDFGLAQLSGRSRLTQPGTVMGTPSYMAPEQLQSEETDRRADVWALGVVFYEMLAQRLPFEAEYREAEAYAILNEEPEALTAQRSDLPLEVDQAISKALSKDRSERYQNVEDLIVDLRRLKKTSGTRRSVAPINHTIPPQPTPVPPPAPNWKQPALIAAIALLSLVVGLLFQRYALPGPVAEQPPGQLRRFSIQPPAGIWTRAAHRMVSISPNGRYIAFTAEPGGLPRRRLLWIQDLQQEEPRRIEGIEVATSPFWSPDSESILVASYDRTENRLLRLPSQGGPASLVSEVRTPFWQGSTSSDGATIVFHAGSPGQAWKVPFGGGEPQPFFSEKEKEEMLADQADAETDVGLFPQFLPSEGGRRGLVFGVGAGDSLERILVMDLENRKWRVIAKGRNAFHSPTGHLLYLDGANLWALPFSLGRLEDSGEPFLIRERVMSPTVSRDGTLVYFDAVYNPEQLVWRSREGERLGLIGDGNHGTISPDESSIALVAGDSLENQAVWIHDLSSGHRIRASKPSRFVLNPVWSSNGQELLFSSIRGRDVHIYLQKADDVNDAKLLFSNPGREFSDDWSSDGRYVIFQRNHTETRKDLWYAERDVETGAWAAPKVMRNSPANELHGRFSPAGRYYAYQSTETGRQEVIVRKFPDGKERWVVSRGDSAGKPRWKKDGSELYYIADGTVYAVPVSTESIFSHQDPVALFKLPPGSHFDDVSADGQRFLSTEPPTERQEPRIRVVENWYEEFRDGREN